MIAMSGRWTFCRKIFLIALFMLFLTGPSYAQYQYSSDDYEGNDRYDRSTALSEDEHGSDRQHDTLRRPSSKKARSGPGVDLAVGYLLSAIIGIPLFILFLKFLGLWS